MKESTASHNNNKPITLNLDEFDLDSFELKPVNKGLGFHDEDKREVLGNQNLKKSAPKLKSSLSSAPRLSGNSFLQNTPEVQSPAGLMSGVEAIYGRIQEEPLKKLAPKENIQTKLREASYLSLISAFLLDFSVITATTLTLLCSFYLIGFQHIAWNGLATFMLDSVLYALAFFGLSFLSYFSLLEPVGTLGKRCLSLKVCHSQSSKNVTIRQSFARAVVSLSSLFLMGIPLILDFQGKLSDSRVVQK